MYLSDFKSSLKRLLACMLVALITTPQKVVATFSNYSHNPREEGCQLGLGTRNFLGREEYG
jgi:hypothetical protein